MMMMMMMMMMMIEEIIKVLPGEEFMPNRFSPWSSLSSIQFGLTKGDPTVNILDPIWIDRRGPHSEYHLERQHINFFRWHIENSR